MSGAGESAESPKALRRASGNPDSRSASSSVSASQTDRCPWPRATSPTASSRVGRPGRSRSTKLAVAGVALQIAAEVGHADADDAARPHDAATFVQQVEPGREGEVLEHVLEEDGLRRPVREGQPPAEVPGEVGRHSEHVDVHPAGRPVGAGAEVEAQWPCFGEQAPGLPPFHGRKQRGALHLRRLPEAERRDTTEQPNGAAALESARPSGFALLQVTT